MFVKYASLREPVVLPVTGWFGGQGHSYSTFIHGDKNMPGLSIVKEDTEIAIFQGSTRVAGVPLANIRGYTYLPDEEVTVEAVEEPAAEVVATTEEPPRRRR